MVGHQFENLQKEKITHTQIVQYAGASGDFNPIHTVVPFAEKAGLGGVIAHGMMIMGFIGQAIVGWFPSNRMENFTVRFKAMTKPGEKIVINGWIMEETDDSWLCEAIASNEAGEVKVEAQFTIHKTIRGVWPNEHNRGKRTERADDYPSHHGTDVPRLKPSIGH